MHLFISQRGFLDCVLSLKYIPSLNRESERIPCSLTSTSSIRPEPFGSELKADLLMAEGSRVAAGMFNHLKT